jgi:homoserine kinase type II
MTLDFLQKHRCTENIQLVIHCDYHPGNLKFKGSQVVGLFDFDWSKIDYRCFDVALALFYFFCSWDGQQDGVLRLDEVKLFLNTYQKSLTESAGPGPLSSTELECMPYMISAANLYVLNWTLYDYLQKVVDPQQYLRFLWHSVNTIRWMDEPTNARKLREIILNLASK